MKKETRWHKTYAWIFLAIFVHTSCASVNNSSHLSNEYKEELIKKGKRQLVAQVSDELVNDEFLYKHKTYISDLDGKWNYFTIAPKEYFYKMVKASSSYLFNTSEKEIADIIIVPEVLSCNIEELSQKKYKTGYQNETIYEKKYRAKINVKVSVYDKSRDEIIQLAEESQEEFVGRGRVQPTCVSSNCWDWANAASIRTGATGALNAAINNMLPNINERIFDEPKIIHLENKKVFLEKDKISK